MDEAMEFSDPLAGLVRGRGRPSREESDALAREAQFLAGKPIEGISAQSATTIDKEPKRPRWWWDAIVDWMFANPGKSLADCANELGRTPQHIYQLTQSDLFKERYQQRLNEKNALLNGQLVSRVAGAAITATQLLQDRLDADARRAVDARTIDLETLSDVNDKLLKSLGYGVKGVSPAVNVNVTQQVIETGADPELLRSAGAKIIEVAPASAAPPARWDTLPGTQPSDAELIDELNLFMDEPTLVAGPDLDPELNRD